MSSARHGRRVQLEMQISITTKTVSYWSEKDHEVQTQSLLSLVIRVYERQTTSTFTICYVRNFYYRRCNLFPSKRLISTAFFAFTTDKES
jgi:hypothetical protein